MPRTHSPQQPGNFAMVCHHLTFEEDDDSSLDNNTLLARMEHHSPVEHPMAHHLTSTDEEEEEHFPTAPLNDDVWMKNQFQTGTYAFMKIHNMICSHTLAHTTWICYISLWIMHLSMWTSVTFSIYKM